MSQTTQNSGHNLPEPTACKLPGLVLCGSNFYKGRRGSRRIALKKAKQTIAANERHILVIQTDSLTPATGPPPPYNTRVQEALLTHGQAAAPDEEQEDDDQAAEIRDRRQKKYPHLLNFNITHKCCCRQVVKPLARCLAEEFLLWCWLLLCMYESSHQLQVAMPDRLSAMFP